MFPFSAKNSLIWGVKCEKLNFIKSQGNSLDKVRKLQMNGTVIQKLLEILSPPEGTEHSRQFLLLRTELLTENCRWVPLFAEHYIQKKTVPFYLKFLNERGGETAVGGSSLERTLSGHEKGVRNWSWLLTTNNGSFPNSRNTKRVCKILKILMMMMMMMMMIIIILRRKLTCCANDFVLLNHFQLVYNIYYLAVQDVQVLQPGWFCFL